MRHRNFEVQVNKGRKQPAPEVGLVNWLEGAQVQTSAKNGRLVLLVVCKQAAYTAASLPKQVQSCPWLACLHARMQQCGTAVSSQAGCRLTHGSSYTHFCAKPTAHLTAAYFRIAAYSVCSTQPTLSQAKSQEAELGAAIQGL